jgi:hypothetical protein
VLIQRSPGVQGFRGSGDNAHEGSEEGGEEGDYFDTFNCKG